MKHLTLIATACALLATFSLHAQEATLPTSDAKALAMGGLQMTTESTSHAIYNNAALAAFSRNPLLVSSSYYHQDYIDSNGTKQTYNVYSVTGGYRVSPQSVIQGGWRQYLRGTNNRESIVDLSYSHAFNDKWALGVVGRYVHQKRPDEKEIDAVAVDLSGAYIRPIENFGAYTTLRTGFKISNLGTYLDDTDYTLPMNATVGTALDTYITDEHEFTLGVDMSYYFYPKTVRGYMMSVGLEYNFMQLIQLRGGYHYGERDSYYPSYGSAGVGIRFLHLRLDFAYLFAKKGTPFRDTYSLSFGLDF